MLNNFRLFRLIHDKRLSVPVLRCFHHEFNNPFAINAKKPKVDEDKPKVEDTPVLTGAISQKFKVFREEESPEIFDVVEERERYEQQDEPEDLYENAYVGLNLESN